MLINFMGRVRRWGPDATLLNSIKKSGFIVTVVSAHKWILSSGPKWTDDILQLYKFPYMEKINRDQKFARRKIYKKYSFTQRFEILQNCIEIHVAWIHLSKNHNYFVFVKHQYFSLNMLILLKVLISFKETCPLENRHSWRCIKQTLNTLIQAVFSYTRI